VWRTATTTQEESEPERYQASVAGEKKPVGDREKRKRLGFSKALSRIYLIFEIQGKDFSNNEFALAN